MEMFANFCHTILGQKLGHKFNFLSMEENYVRMKFIYFFNIYKLLMFNLFKNKSFLRNNLQRKLI